MLLVYDHENVLHITNEKGLRWNYEKTQKPQFLFGFWRFSNEKINFP